MSAVSIVRCQRYDLEEVQNALNNIIDHTEFPEVSGKTVLIKPNLLSDAPIEKAITTNPVCIEALIRILRERKAEKILVGDSPSLHKQGFLPVRCGLMDILNRYSIEFSDFLDSPKEHLLSNGEKVLLAKALDEADVVISFAKMKTHQLMGATGCVKNMFGCIPGLNKSAMHVRNRSRRDFAQMINALFEETRTSYGFLDGIIAMEGPGPNNGWPRKTGILIGSADCYAIDTAEGLLMGYKPQELPILKEHGKAEIVYTDGRPEDFRMDDFRRSYSQSVFSALILSRLRIQHRPYPSIEDDKCHKCLKCKEICPAGAMIFDGSSVSCHPEKCIRCYCCHEVCPYDAIRLK